jgi:hypothetical protein
MKRGNPLIELCLTSMCKGITERHPLSGESGVCFRVRSQEVNDLLKRLKTL